jgi:hypothetical protein
MEPREIGKLKQLARDATPGNWGDKWVMNYPFYVDVSKPSPSLSKHDDDRPTYWRMEDGIFSATFTPDRAIKLLNELEYWIKDSGEAWDKCEERRQQAYKYKIQNNILIEALEAIRKAPEGVPTTDFDFRLRAMTISSGVLEKIYEYDKK